MIAVAFLADNSSADTISLSLASINFSYNCTDFIPVPTASCRFRSQPKSSFKNLRIRIYISLDVLIRITEKYISGVGLADMNCLISLRSLDWALYYRKKSSGTSHLVRVHLEVVSQQTIFTTTKLHMKIKHTVLLFNGTIKHSPVAT